MFNVDISVERAVRSMMHRVYGWMSLGLAITATVAYFVSTSPAIMRTLFSNPWLLIGLIIAQLSLVLGLQLAIHKISTSTACALFAGYAALTGLTLSALFLVYTHESVVVTFISTAGMFGAMSLYGYFTNQDLSSMGKILFMALIGLVIAGLVNLFWHNTMFELLVSAVGVALFSLLTAYDTQKLKQMGQSMLIEGYPTAKISVLGALTLYLDFINLFLYLLKFLGKKRND